MMETPRASMKNRSCRLSGWKPPHPPSPPRRVASLATGRLRSRYIFFPRTIVLVRAWLWIITCGSARPCGWTRAVDSFVGSRATQGAADFMLAVKGNSYKGARYEAGDVTTGAALHPPPYPTRLSEIFAGSVGFLIFPPSTIMQKPAILSPTIRTLARHLSPSRLRSFLCGRSCHRKKCPSLLLFFVVEGWFVSLRW